MSEQEKKLAGPDFALGMALADIDEGGMILGHVAVTQCYWRAGVTSCSRSAPNAPTTTVRSLRGSSSRTPSAAPGTMQVSV
jgi:hypothetical protein